MGKLSYVLKNTLLNIKRAPLLVFATIIAVLVSSFLVFTTLSARSIVQNNTLRWQSGVHVVVFLDDRVTTTAHKQLQESLESYPEVRIVDYFSKSEAKEEFQSLFKDQPELLAEVDFEILPSSLRINLNDPSDYTLIIERLEGNPAVKEIRSSGEAIERITNSNLSSMVITDTIEPTENVTKCNKIRIITAAPLLAHAMLNISNESSVSSLFSEESLKPIYEGLYSN